MKRIIIFVVIVFGLYILAQMKLKDTDFSHKLSQAIADLCDNVQEFWVDFREFWVNFRGELANLLRKSKRRGSRIKKIISEVRENAEVSMESLRRELNENTPLSQDTIEILTHLSDSLWQIAIEKSRECGDGEEDIHGLNCMYKAIDLYASMTPQWVANSTRTLSYFLTKPARDEKEKIRSIYWWITHNIRYDEGYILGEHDLSFKSTSAVLKERVAVCSGYANLFETLARKAGLEAVTIHGYAKGYGYEIGQHFSRPDHAWNAVKLEGAWYLVDCTWGSGYWDPVTRTHKMEYEDFYFLTPAHLFIYSHFPLDERWQLLDQPLQLNEFEDLPEIKPLFFKLNLRIGNFSECTIETDTPLTVYLYAPEEVIFLANIYRHSEDSNVLVAKVNREGEKVSFYIDLQEPGEYILRIFASSGQSLFVLYREVIVYSVRFGMERRRS
ncbi:MAG: hypothetical protein DRG83_05995 [Deltaproteobacteria bacterium]|nr:MAG: hypothetical protein DRG83_05995 [Deltaproteobacteria bacterium]